jgi:hypothetical protein
MPSTYANDTSTLVIGVAGIFALLLIAMGFAYWSSGKHYELEQVHPLVLEQAANGTR